MIYRKEQLIKTGFAFEFPIGFIVDGGGFGALGTLVKCCINEIFCRIGLEVGVGGVVVFLNLLMITMLNADIKSTWIALTSVGPNEDPQMFFA